MHINKGMNTPGGPHYPVAEGIVIKAHTWELLYKLIAEYRLRAGQPQGDIEKDVNDYTCAKWPHMCRMDEADSPAKSERGKTLPSRVAAWAANKSVTQPIGGYELVPIYDAEKRAEACINCPNNRGWITCAACIAKAQSLLLSIRKLRKTKFDNSLLACELCGHDNQTAIHFRLENLKEPTETPQQLPPGCWKRL